MQPLGNKILVRDIIEEKKSESGLILDTIREHYKRVEVVSISPDSKLIFFNEAGEIVCLKAGDKCLANTGGVELERGLWLCNEDLLDCKL
jgi:co-chaperonin GroES (HSP10)